MNKIDFKILLLHNNKDLLKKIKQYLKINKYKVYASTNSLSALYLQKKISPDIIITSINPKGILKNKELLKAFLDVKKIPVIILLVDEHEEKEDLNKIPEEFWFDIIYIDDNINQNTLTIIERAKKFYIERNTLFQYLKEYDSHWNRQLEWLLWKEYHKTLFKTNTTNQLITNIRNTLLQGVGINSILSYIELIDLKKIQEDNYYKIPKVYFEQIKKDSEKLILWFQNLEKLLYSLKKEFTIENIDSEQMYKIIVDLQLTVEEFRIIKNQKICVGNLEFKGNIKFNKEAFLIIFKELLTNAFKYSPENSYIDIIVFDYKNYILIGILNDILEFKGGITGIPEEYENQIFEPFVKLNHHFDERFINEDFGLGVGLTIVKFYLQYFNSNIYLKEIVDYTREPKKRILCGVVINK